MQNYQFTSQHQYGESNPYLTKILEKAKGASQFTEFMVHFYQNTPMDQEYVEKAEFYIKLAQNAFEFFLEKTEETKIRIYQDYFAQAEQEFNVIEILCLERPFIFDSVISYLNRNEIGYEYAIHPNILVARDAKGKLKNISKNGSNELLVQLILSENHDSNSQEKIFNDLKHILSLIALAVNDWQPIVTKLQEFINQQQANLTKDFVENYEFLNLFKEKFFVFLGYASLKLNEGQFIFDSDSALGILKQDYPEIIADFKADIAQELKKNKADLLFFSKLSHISVIHRSANIDAVYLKTFNSNHELIAVKVFIGLYTSILFYKSATLIPIIRAKIKYVLHRSSLSYQSYSGKEVISIFEALPREELFLASDIELYDLVMEIYALIVKQKFKLVLIQRSKIIKCLVFLNIDDVNFNNTNLILNALNFRFGRVISEQLITINSSKLCFLNVSIDGSNYHKAEVNLVELEQELDLMLRPWSKSLQITLVKHYGKIAGNEIYKDFAQAFPNSYIDNNYLSTDIIQDIEKILKVKKSADVDFRIVNETNFSNKVGQIRVYYPAEISLSRLMPVLNNFGFSVVSEQVYELKLHNDNSWLHVFNIELNPNSSTKLIEHQDKIYDALLAIWHNQTQNDNLNQLIVLAGLTYSQVDLLRALISYLIQVKIGFSINFIVKVLTQYWWMTLQLVELFALKFNHNLMLSDRMAQVDRVNQLLVEDLQKIKDVSEDQLLGKIINLVNSITRTNFFVRKEKKSDYLSFKIDSSKLKAIPLPRPFCEIFVYANDFEAIHLRGGKVARGGLRWSDRLEDYRSEVLGLMKTQIVKNSVIVPSGAKGGFVIKNSANYSRAQIAEKAVMHYQNFLRGMLDLTDNIVENQIKKPDNLICYDDDDPYLVVAADKGTASFSDHANKVANEYNFWLGDAFASGGSQGYDHKKMAITARGAWLSVQRHFIELGKDILNDEFTVVAIGDMSGDVFGNGMLLSNKIKLIAAFNHQHIFIDPNPSSQTSYQERKRLFSLPSSTWLDYDSNILSPGGRIFDRQLKELELTDEIRDLFNIAETKIQPNHLIRRLLTADCDLLYNGGIGTYVKAKFETNEQVLDKTNDNVRVNAEDLRCKIVAEGGNLGFTQNARVEYAHAGGKINTDAIDNSGGVDCSDHEVNIKIALSLALKQKLLSMAERNELLEQMTEEVAQLVLQDNYNQNLVLSITQKQGNEILGSQKDFITILEKENILDRKLEYLPTNQYFDELFAKQQSLSRPELSILLAYAKNSIYDKLIKTKLADDGYFLADLVSYFPKQMQKILLSVIKDHPLKREIITTNIANSMVNHIDSFYFELMLYINGYEAEDIAKAYVITKDVFNISELTSLVNQLDGLISSELFFKIHVIIKKFIMRLTSWLLRNGINLNNLTEKIEFYKSSINELNRFIKQALCGQLSDHLKNEVMSMANSGLSLELAENIALLGPLTSAFSIFEVKQKTGAAIDIVVENYYSLFSRLRLDWLLFQVNLLKIDNNWQKLAIRALKDQIYDLVQQVTIQVIENNNYHDSISLVDAWLAKNYAKISSYDSLVDEIKRQTNLEYQMFNLILNKLLSIL